MVTRIGVERRTDARCGWLVAPLLALTALACGHEPSTQPRGPAAFSGEFKLVAADDWTAKQSCNYVIPTDEWVCTWGHLAITADRLAISVRGYVVHLGLPSGPVIHQDSIRYVAPVRILDPCSVAIDSTGITPNGQGVLAGDTLHFYGHSMLGDSLSWGYSVVQVQLTSPCPV